MLIIGIDGGATKVSAWQVVYNPENEHFSLAQHHTEKRYSDVPGFIKDFTPVDLKMQLQERAISSVILSFEEQQQETVFVEACALVVQNLVQKINPAEILLGIGMPGLKTANKRGIEVVANGPRMLHYCDLLERRLEAINIRLISPVYHLGSDADFCGIGENYSENGLFKNCKNALYLGGGTGVADALKLNGRLVPFDEAKVWIAKTWEMKSTQNLSLERYCSANGIQNLYAQNSGKNVADLIEKNIFLTEISTLALNGDSAAIETFRQVTENLAGLIFSRMTTVYAGWQNDFEFINPAKPALSVNHEYSGILFEKIILGQRIGDLFAEPSARKYFSEPLLNNISGLVKNSKMDQRFCAYYSNPKDIITASHLREAPALGAGIDAFLTWKGLNG